MTPLAGRLNFSFAVCLVHERGHPFDKIGSPVFRFESTVKKALFRFVPAKRKQHVVVSVLFKNGRSLKCVLVLKVCLPTTLSLINTRVSVKVVALVVFS